MSTVENVLTMKRIRPILAIALTLSCLITYGQRELLDKVIAQVGTEYVFLSDLEEQYALLKDQQGSVPNNARCLILESLLISKLLINQAKIDSLVVSDEEVEAQLTARIDQILDYMGGDVRQFEEYYGQSINDVKQAFRDDLRNKLLSERMNQKVMADISVTPSEVKSFFRNIPRDSLPYFNSEVEVGELVYKPLMSESQAQMAREKLEAIRRRIVEGGEDFAELAKKFSDDFGSARLGGDLGWTKRGKFVPAFEAAAYSLEEGEISPVIESEFGFHIIQLLSRRGNAINTRHILVKPEITEEDLQRASYFMDSIRQLLISGHSGFSQAVKKWGIEDVQSYHNDGKMINPTAGNSYFEIADLDPEIYFTIDTMDVSAYSKPFSYTTPKGEVFFRIIQLQSRTEPHRASLERDYAKIQMAAIEQKKTNYLMEWMQDEVMQTYVHIDERYVPLCSKILQPWMKDSSKP